MKSQLQYLEELLEDVDCFQENGKLSNVTYIQNIDYEKKKNNHPFIDLTISPNDVIPKKANSIEAEIKSKLIPVNICRGKSRGFLPSPLIPKISQPNSALVSFNQSETAIKYRISNAHVILSEKVGPLAVDLFSVDSYSFLTEFLEFPNKEWNLQSPGNALSREEFFQYCEKESKEGTEALKLFGWIELSKIMGGGVLLNEYADYQERNKIIHRIQVYGQGVIFLFSTVELQATASLFPTTKINSVIKRSPLSFLLFQTPARIHSIAAKFLKPEAAEVISIVQKNKSEVISVVQKKKSETKNINNIGSLLNSLQYEDLRKTAAQISNHAKKIMIGAWNAEDEKEAQRMNKQESLDKYLHSKRKLSDQQTLNNRDTSNSDSSESSNIWTHKPFMPVHKKVHQEKDDFQILVQCDYLDEKDLNSISKESFEVSKQSLVGGKGAKEKVSGAKKKESIKRNLLSQFELTSRVVDSKTVN